MKNKLEISLAIGLAAMLLYCAFPLHPMQWWSVAFSPLCNGMLTDPVEGEIVLRSGFLALISGVIRSS